MEFYEIEFIKLIKQFQNEFMKFKFNILHARSKSFFESKIYNILIFFVCLIVILINVFYNFSPKFLLVYKILDISFFMLVNLEFIIKVFLLKKEMVNFWIYKIEIIYFILNNSIFILNMLLKMNIMLSILLFLKVIISFLMILHIYMKDFSENSIFRKSIETFFCSILKIFEIYIFIFILIFILAPLMINSNPEGSFEYYFNFLLK